MKIFPAESIRELDAYTIENEPIASIDLMERAAQAVTDVLTRQFSTERPVMVFAGPGNNGGDALAIARMLAEQGYRTDVFLFNPKAKLSPDCLINKELLELMEDVEFTEVTTQFTPPVLTKEHVVIDGLFGSGLNQPLAGGFAAVVKLINASPATVVSVDVPSGLMCEDNTGNAPVHIVRANLTISLQLPKLAFFFAENQEFIGRWQLVDIGLSQEGIELTETDYELVDRDDIGYFLETRKKFAHKGDFGHALLIAGSQGMAGASVLAAKACLRSGVGLLTVHAPALNNVILQTAAPEAMIEADRADDCFTASGDIRNYRAIGVGPGLGQQPETEDALLDLLQTCRVPLVLDADALNLLARHPELLTTLPEGSILTPHPKELERLVGPCENSFQRLVKARQLAHEAQVHIILKGAYSVVITPAGHCYLNTTGNPGMATGGSGDVLTGIVLALLAQGYPPERAALLATFAHGLAGDMAAHKLGEISLTASDIVQYLPYAWRAIAD